LGQKRIRWNVELVKKELALLGFFMIENKYVNSNIKIALYDKYGYFYFSTLNKILRGNILKFHKSNPYTMQNIDLWCNINNKLFKPLSNNKYINRKVKLKFICLKDDCGEEFESTLNDILDNCGCPFCAGKKVGLSNCLATKRPDLAAEWHPILNGDLTPYDVTCGSGKDIWWQCKNNFEHVWQSKIYNRNKGDGCPYCSGKYPSTDYNLLVINPDLCENWNYEKNDKRPEEYCPNSGDSVWWKCKDCGYEWKAIIDNMNKNRTCSRCSETKGEKAIDKVLINNHVNYIYHHTFPDCKFINVLEYDFYLPNYNIAIEYQGRQHYEPVDFAGKGQKWAEEQFILNQKRDEIKRDYCNKNNIKLLEIPYWHFDNISSILSKTLQ
jgi:hypothetical protein